MRIYNTATHRKEEFIPRQEGKVAMYVCGPTVYNHIHIGNARTFISFDVIRRYLAWRGYAVTFVQNITDVDDKIIARAAQEGRSAAEVAQEYSDAFIDVMHSLDVLDPDVRPRATEEIPAMIGLVTKLIDGGYAYERDGSVYFSVRSYSRYGELSGRDVDELRGGSRDMRGGDFAEDKDDPLDFALWKAAKPGEPSWESPWGQGRPGWHIECSAMADKYLGLPLDIHGGGSDLVFPHHENETAQSQAAYGMCFCKLWMHGGMLQVADDAGRAEKMSKSLGNFLLARDVAQSYPSAVIRLLMLQTSYRSPLVYSKERLDEAQAAYERIVTAIGNIDWAVGQSSPVSAIEGEASAQALALGVQNTRARERFIELMDDDFNTAGALGELFALVSAANTALCAFQEGDASCAQFLIASRNLLAELLGTLGISLETDDASELPQGVLDLAAEVVGYGGDDRAQAVELLLAERAKARLEKDWARADAVRDGLAALSLKVEDTPSGSRVVP